jgi:hypothetical protein
MTQIGAAFLVGVGLLAGLFVLPSVNAEPAYGLLVFATSALIGAVGVGLLFVFNRHRFRRAYGWYGLNSQQRQKASSNVDSALVGKVSAAGGTLGLALIAAFASLFGVSGDLLVVVVGGLLAGFLVGLGILQSYHQWRAREFYGAEHDVTDI